ncbi:Rhodanese domain protein [Psychromonas ingrahamii 37]|uniref:Rhodanese domain protein n=1 Tax=Psychromonas ingrahamii (strain DSM 17664 / CCUG 51855 / 37) TaxID=357804 RepID=A1ST98_PSYIN|nr:rhodanese-like domain-containing protein [Psychromonas ingrahamii]ABM02713.1 Rhodanese domain protein [Psychromonas ingrahamii 37]
MIIKNMLKLATLLLFSSFCNAQVSHIEPQQLIKQIQNEKLLVILDVRTENEYTQGHIQGAINIPYDQLRKEQDKIIAYKDQQVILYCHSGRRADMAARTLQALGFTKLIDLTGHMVLWEQLQYPLVN